MGRKQTLSNTLLNGREIKPTDAYGSQANTTRGGREGRTTNTHTKTYIQAEFLLKPILKHAVTSKVAEC